MPGVNIVTTVRGDSSTPLDSNSGQLFVAGLAERGRTDVAVNVRGLADFETQFGGRTTYSYLYDTVRCFFEEGGEQAWIARVVGPASSVGTVEVQDRATTPVPTVRIDARSAGSWSQNITATVSAGSLPDTIRVVVSEGDHVLQSINNIASIDELVTRFSTSPYVVITDLGSATAAPGNLPALGDYTLTAGADDRSSITATNVTKALDLFTAGLGDGAVAIPGYGADVHPALIDHAETNKRIALLSMDVDTDAQTLSDEAATLDTDAAGLFAPWVTVADNAGGTRPVPPEGYVAGVRSRAHSEVGPHRAPAGGMAVAASVVGLATEFSTAVADALDEAKVSVIRRINNTVRLYGWRSLSNDVANFGFLNNRDVLNRVVTEAERRLENYVFAPIDAKGQTLSSIEAELVGICEPLRQRGALYEREVNGKSDGGYQIETGSSVNTEETLGRGELRARLSLRVAPIGSMVSLNIVKVGLLQNF